MVQVGDDDWLYRRLHPYCFKKDGSLSSTTFMQNGFPGAEASVDLARLTTPEVSVNRSVNKRLGKLQAADARELESVDGVKVGLRVCHTFEEDNRAHTLIKGLQTKKQCKDLASRVILMDDVRSDVFNPSDWPF